MLEEDIRYTLRTFLADRATILAVAALGMVILFGTLRVSGLTWEGALLCILVMALMFSLCLAISYRRNARYFQELLATAKQVQQPHELPELLPKTRSLETRATQEALELVSRTASDQVISLKSDNDVFKQFVNLWIHEVKTPIAASKLTLARMHGPDADTLTKELSSISRLVEQVLYCSRASNLHEDYAIKQLDLADMAKECCKSNASLLIEAGVSPRFEIPANTLVNADKQWLSFALSQLCVNAVKYGASTLTFSAKQSPDSESPSLGQTVLSISDNGWGIPPEDMPSIFKPSFVGQNGRRAGSATGMGLYLVSVMCDRMGLTLSCTSEVNSGTRFDIGFPYNHALDDAYGNQNSAASQGASSQTAAIYESERDRTVRKHKAESMGAK